MKTIILIISLLLLLKAQAQTPVTSTNLPTVAEALKIASSLQFRMKESDADKYLVNHGLICDTNRTLAIYSQNLTNGYPTFSTSYPLKDNCCLDLYYWHADSPDTWTNTDKRWEQNSILTGAEIESNWTGGYPPHYYRGSWAEIQSNDLKNYTQINLTNSK